ncbi:MAG: bifunctional fucokinase/L-fucose-1-P-guanylyltransferase [Lachnospiraceae bacterium]|nr:bifunctional fucokinase/L-fucose-1-P-guanylyltransferase [Lachnospiraceae bacterium]
MNPQKLKNLFLRQSYQDAWTDYERSLKKRYFIHWDYVILTASNEEQAEAYREQIDLRLSRGFLPEQTHYAVLPDPDGKRVGSGGATFHVMKYIREQEGRPDCFAGKRILVIHSGGDSKRVPQYSACGKLFSPVPRELPDGRRSTLFDEFMISMSGMPARFKEGMLVLSGDVLLMFNPLQIDCSFRGAAAISIKEHVETGKNHGVFLGDSKGNVGQFLHKQSVEQLQSLGAVNAQGNVDLDTGAILLDAELLQDLFGLISENGQVVPEKFERFVNEKARVSFYGDFLYPLASEATFEQYLKEKPEGSFCKELEECRYALWQVLHPYSLKLICLSPAQFIHFGTTRELLSLMTEEIENYEFLDWKGQILGVEETPGVCAYSNSYIERDTKTPASSYIEDSYIYSGSCVGERCVISGVTLRGQQIPDGVTMHGLKLKDGRFVVRIYGTYDNPKGMLEEGTSFLNTILSAFLQGAGLTPEEVWPDQEQYLWLAKLYPICDTIEEAVEAAVAMTRIAAGQASSEEMHQYKNAERTSLYESFNQADTKEILAWQQKLTSQVCVTRFLRALERRDSVDEAKSVFGVQGISPAQVERLISMAESLPFGLRMRIYYYLSKMTEGSVSEDLENKCFAYLCDSLYEASIGTKAEDSDYHIREKEVVVKLPVRVNFGGGWSDTPPYCNEHGGTVLNAALKLNGILPVVVTLRHMEKKCIALSSTDSGAYHEFTSLEELQSCHDPFDPFALHKAALLTCGIIPQPGAGDGEQTMEAIYEKLRGGLYLNTEVIGIPRGSGLGTSSILAGACVKGIFQYIGKEVEENELYSYVLCMEQMMSTGGGWQDQVGGLTEGAKLIHTRPGLLQEIQVEHLNIPPAAMEELKERFVLIYTGQRRLARNLLREIVGGYIGSNPNSIEVLSEIQKKALLMRAELEKGNVDGFAKLLDEHWELSKRLDRGCTNTCIEQIFLSCEELLDGKMICGAGGGGFLQAVLKKGCTKEDLRQRIRAVFQDSGVDVWDCELI